MSILLVGLNHRTAPVEVREQLAFSRDGVATALILFRNQFPGSEAVILSTCNRVEMVVASETDRPNLNDVISFLAQAHDLPVANFKMHLYQFIDEQAIRHLFRVTSGLDSMVLGEYQIVNQIKEAYAQASEQGTTGRILNRLYHAALSVGKRIRTETRIGECKVSVASAAVDVAKGIFSDFSDKHTLVVGAGETAQLVCQHLRHANATRFTVTTRTHNNAKALAEACHGEAVPFEQLDEQLTRADIIITAVSCPKALITSERMRQAQKHRQGRPVFIIDLAVPRNVDSEVGQLNQVFVYNVDELGRIVAEGRQQRISQLEQCESIVNQEIELFMARLEEQRIKPVIEQMYNDVHELADMELKRLFKGCPDLTPEQRLAVAQFGDRLIGKLMHPCVTTLRQGKSREPSIALADAIHMVALKQRRS